VVVTATIEKRPRSQWSAQQRQQIVAESLAAGVSVDEVARRHGVRPNLLSTWRRQERGLAVAQTVKFAAVRVSAAPSEGWIEIDLVAQCVRVRGKVDGAMLREVLAVVR
jgi:transposase